MQPRAGRVGEYLRTWMEPIPTFLTITANFYRQLHRMHVQIQNVRGRGPYKRMQTDHMLCETDRNECKCAVGVEWPIKCWLNYGYTVGNLTPFVSRVPSEFLSTLNTLAPFVYTQSLRPPVLSVAIKPAVATGDAGPESYIPAKPGPLRGVDPESPDSKLLSRWLGYRVTFLNEYFRRTLDYYARPFLLQDGTKRRTCANSLETSVSLPLSYQTLKLSNFAHPTCVLA